MVSIADVERVGLSVELAFRLGDVAVWFVSGDGVETYVRDDDEDALASLAALPAG